MQTLTITFFLNVACVPIYSRILLHIIQILPAQYVDENSIFPMDFWIFAFGTADLREFGHVTEYPR